MQAISRGNILKSVGKLIIYAPGVHLGGGEVLLKSLLASLPSEMQVSAYLDGRARSRLEVGSNVEVIWINQSLIGRLISESMLSFATDKNTNVLCLHGLPPLFINVGQVSIFILNRILLSDIAIGGLNFRTKIRCFLERSLLLLRNKTDFLYYVHTESAKADLIKTIPKIASDAVAVTPLVANLPEIRCSSKADKRFDFFYPCHGEGHKNHFRLIDSWVVLAHKGHFPTLALTLGHEYKQQIDYMTTAVEEHGIKITNLDNQPHAEIMSLYKESRALIFPSLVEAYGLPLIEAQLSGLPILAGELDFVRDICDPAETFDVFSELSISRAVERFLYSKKNTHQSISADQFWSIYQHTGKL